MTGIDETSLMMLVAQMMKSDDLRNQKTQNLQKLLNEENGWLREELAYTQKRLQESESAVARLEEELNQLRFLDSMKNVICDTVRRGFGRKNRYFSDFLLFWWFS